LFQSSRQFQQSTAINPADRTVSGKQQAAAQMAIFWDPGGFDQLSIDPHLGGIFRIGLRYPRTTLTALKGDPHVLAKLEGNKEALKRTSGKRCPAELYLAGLVLCVVRRGFQLRRQKA
jgi:hypothetical protein